MIWLTYLLTFFFKTSLGATTVYYSVIFILGNVFQQINPTFQNYLVLIYLVV